MRAMLLAFMLLPAPAAAQDGLIKLPAKCKPAGGLIEHKHDSADGPRKLNEMPPAVEIRALWRVVDGCPQPIVLQRGIGHPSHQKGPPVNGVPRAQNFR